MQMTPHRRRSRPIWRISPITICEIRGNGSKINGTRVKGQRGGHSEEEPSRSVLSLSSASCSMIHDMHAASEKQPKFLPFDINKNRN